MRLSLLLASAAVLSLGSATLSVQAQTQPAPPPAQDEPIEVEITEGVLKPFPIAVLGFSGQNGSEIAGVVRGNLRRSGYFEPLDPGGFIETSLPLQNQPNFGQWTAIGAQAVLYGAVTQRPDGRNDVGFRLYDPYRQCQLVAYRFTATPDQWRRIAHKIADMVYQRMTGETGLFDSRVIFVAESGTQQNRVSRLAISDQDGYSPIYLTQGGDEVIMSPRFSLSNPDEVTYVALGRDYSRIYLLNLSTGRRESLGEFDGQVLAPRFSNDGTKLAFSIIRNGNTDVYVMDLRSRQLARLTTDPGIDTSASFSPDNSQLVFNSDRTGTPRLYVMNADGSGQRAISRGGGVYTAPAWSPRGDYIAFTKQAGGQFATGVMRTDGSGERILSRSYFEEGPSWSPNGRYIMFSRQARGGEQRLWTVDLSGRVVAQAGYEGRAIDPAWSPLLDGAQDVTRLERSADACGA